MKLNDVAAILALLDTRRSSFEFAPTHTPARQTWTPVRPKKQALVFKPVQPAHAAKRARKAAGVHGRKASKRFYREHRADYVGAQA